MFTLPTGPSQGSPGSLLQRTCSVPLLAFAGGLAASEDGTIMNAKAVVLAGVLLVAGTVYFLTRGPARTGEAVGQPPAAVLEPEQPKESADLAAPELGAAPDVARVERTAAPAESGKIDSARAKEAPLTISGRLVDERGAPVAGAKVMVGTAGPGPEFALDEIGDMGGMGAWMALETVQSSVDGRFEAPLGRKSNTVQISARHSGNAPFDQRFDVKPGKNDLGDLKLAAGAIVGGRVVDSRGTGVAGVEVHRKRVGNDMFASFSPFAGPVVAVSDERGAFEVDQLAIGDYKLSFTHAEHPDAVHEGSTAAGSERQTNIEVRLEDGYPVQGVVTGIEGKWTDDLHVSASKGGGAFGMPDFGGRRGKVEKDGSFRIGGLSHEATYKLSVVRGDKNDMRQMMRGRGAGGVEAKGGDRGVRVPFQSETAIEGQVVDARTKAPVTSFRVEAGAQWKVPLTDEKGKPQTSFPEGRFRFANLMRMNKDAKVGLTIVADGYRSYEKNGIVAKEGETTELGLLELEPAPMARITVVDATTSKPVANAKVSLEPVKQDGTAGAIAFAVGGSDDEELPFMPAGSARTSKTGKDGVALVAMEPGKRLRPAVQAKGYAPWKGEEFTAPVDGEQAIGAGLVEGGTVIVKVVDTAGKPMPKQVVELDSDAAGMPWMNGQPKTDAKGEVEFKNLLPGPQRFRIAGGGGMFGGGRVRMRASRVEADGMSIDIGGDDEPQWSTVQVADKGRHELVLTVPVRASITGIVRERGRPVAGVSVRADDDGGFGGMLVMGFGGDAGVKTDASGRYTLDDVKAGTTKLVVTAPSRAMSHTQTVEVAEGENTLDIDLPACSVEGRVTDDKGAPVVGAKVRAVLAKGEEDSGGSVSMVMAIDSGEADGQVMEFGGGENASTTTDADGRYMLRGLRAGKKLQVDVRAKEARPKRSDEFELGMDEAKTGLDIVVLPGASLDVSLRRADGKDAMFFAQAVRIDDKGEETTDTAQQFAQKAKTKLTGLAPGRWKVTVRPVVADPDGAGTQPEDLEPKTVEVRSGQKNEVVFDL